MAAKVLSSVKQTAISHLYQPIATFQTCHQLPLSFQLLFDSDITDLPYTSRPGNSMELVSTRVSTKPFAAIPAAKSDVEVRLLNPSVAPTPATKWRLTDLFFKRELKSSKYGIFMFPPSKYYPR